MAVRRVLVETKVGHDDELIAELVSQERSATWAIPLGS